MADFDFIPINTTAENLERIANMNILTDKIETEDDSALVTATALLKTGSLNGKKGSFSIWQPNTHYNSGDMVIGSLEQIQYVGVEETVSRYASVIAVCKTKHTSSDNFSKDYNFGADITDPGVPVSYWEEEVHIIQTPYEGVGEQPNDFGMGFIPNEYATKEELKKLQTKVEKLENTIIKILEFLNLNTSDTYLVSSDGYILQDINGLYLTFKESA